MGLDSTLPGGRCEEGFPEIVGRSLVMRELRRAMAPLAASDITVHIHGETGTGKERVALALHAHSSRRRRRFVPFNAAGFTDELFDAEFFGHAKGAFTGAVAEREGFVAAAEGGTLFIDEVGELSARAQAKLLRFLQEHVYHRLGETSPRKADVRVLSATNVDLKRRVAEGRFRDDLLYRLNADTLRVPPLRDRGEDVALLARYFLREAGARANVCPPVLDPDALRALLTYSWPGNVRQLDNEMERLVAHVRGGPALAADLSPDVVGLSLEHASPLRKSMQVYEREQVRQAIERHGGPSRAAAELGITRQALYKKRRRYGL